MYRSVSQGCHRFPEEEMRARVERIQERHHELRNRAMDGLVDLIHDIQGAQQQGVAAEELAPALQLQRKAQFLLDFAEAENSTGFHAPQEGSRILGTSLDYARQGSKSLAAIWQKRALASQPREGAKK